MKCLKKLSKCNKCRIRKECIAPVYPIGNEGKNGVMIIGQNPGFEEDKSGMPFVGRAGKFLNDYLYSCGIERDDCYITNSVKCHTHSNRPPDDVECNICSKLWLINEVEELCPQLVILLGKIAASSFLGYSPYPFEEYLGDVMGGDSSVLTKNVKWVVVLPHPSAVGYKPQIYQKYYNQMIPKLKNIMKEFKHE